MQIDKDRIKQIVKEEFSRRHVFLLIKNDEDPIDNLVVFDSHEAALEEKETKMKAAEGSDLDWQFIIVRKPVYSYAIKKL
tara:strand:+ start:113 stop:352 length:240 start_codon:yes stop_codon:yes gene_type:complete